MERNDVSADRAARSSVSRVPPDRSCFARAWWRDSRFPPLGIKERTGLDLENLSFVAGDGVDRSAGCFRRTRPSHCWGDIALDFWVQGIRALFWIISRLVDDGRRLRRNRCGRHCILDTASARRRARYRLVRLFYGGAGFRHRIDPAYSNPAQPRPWRTTKNVVEHRGLYLHRLDVRTSGFSGERDECLRISLLRHLRDGIESRQRVYTWQIV